jgi:hypothetical protein
MQSQANSVGHDPVLRNAADGVAFSHDATADAAVTAAGQFIVLCLNPATIVVSIYEIAAGATLRDHKRPFVPYADVLTGTLRVTDTQTGHATSMRPETLSSKRLDSGIELLTSRIGR